MSKVTDWSRFEWEVPDTPFIAFDNCGNKHDVIDVQTVGDEIMFITPTDKFDSRELSISPIPEFPTSEIHYEYSWKWGDLDLDWEGQGDGTYDSENGAMCDEIYHFTISFNNTVISKFSDVCGYRTNNVEVFDGDIERIIDKPPQQIQSEKVDEYVSILKIFKKEYPLEFKEVVSNLLK